MKKTGPTQGYEKETVGQKDLPSKLQNPRCPYLGQQCIWYNYACCAQVYNSTQIPKDIWQVAILPLHVYEMLLLPQLRSILFASRYHKGHQEYSKRK